MRNVKSEFLLTIDKGLKATEQVLLLKMKLFLFLIKKLEVVPLMDLFNYLKG